MSWHNFLDIQIIFFLIFLITETDYYNVDPLFEDDFNDANDNIENVSIQRKFNFFFIWF